MKQQIIEILREPYFKGYREEIQADYLLSLISDNLPKWQDLIQEDTKVEDECMNKEFQHGYNKALSEIKELLNK
jgi:hypothetical protein